MDKDVIEQRFHNGVGPDKRWACIGWRSEVVCEAFDFFDNISCITVFFYQSLYIGQCIGIRVRMFMHKREYEPFFFGKMFFQVNLEHAIQMMKPGKCG